MLPAQKDRWFTAQPTIQHMFAPAQELLEVRHGQPLTSLPKNPNNTMNPKLRTLFDFIREHDSLGYFHEWTNNHLRDHIWFSKEENKSLFYYMDRGLLKGIIEFYREDDYKALVQRIIRGLSDGKRVRSKRCGKIVFVHNLFVDKNHVVLKNMLTRFIKYLKDFDNIYWWKLKNNQILLCKLRRNR